MGKPYKICDSAGEVHEVTADKLERSHDGLWLNVLVMMPTKQTQAFRDPTIGGGVITREVDGPAQLQITESYFQPRWSKVILEHDNEPTT
jgi:hypothetical protein